MKPAKVVVRLPVGLMKRAREEVAEVYPEHNRVVALDLCFEEALEDWLSKREAQKTQMQRFGRDGRMVPPGRIE